MPSFNKWWTLTPTFLSVFVDMVTMEIDFTYAPLLSFCCYSHWWNVMDSAAIAGHSFHHDGYPRTVSHFTVSCSLIRCSCWLSQWRQKMIIHVLTSLRPPAAPSTPTENSFHSLKTATSEYRLACIQPFSTAFTGHLSPRWEPLETDC